MSKERTPSCPVAWIEKKLEKKEIKTVDELFQVLQMDSMISNTRKRGKCKSKSSENEETIEQATQKFIAELLRIPCQLSEQNSKSLYDSFYYEGNEKVPKEFKPEIVKMKNWCMDCGDCDLEKSWPNEKKKLINCYEFTLSPGSTWSPEFSDVWKRYLLDTHQINIEKYYVDNNLREIQFSDLRFEKRPVKIHFTFFRLRNRKTKKSISIPIPFVQLKAHGTMTQRLYHAIQEHTLDIIETGIITNGYGLKNSAVKKIRTNYKAEIQQKSYENLRDALCKYKKMAKGILEIGRRKYTGIFACDEANGVATADKISLIAIYPSDRWKYIDLESIHTRPFKMMYSSGVSCGYGYKQQFIYAFQACGYDSHDATLLYHVEALYSAIDKDQRKIETSPHGQQGTAEIMKARMIQLRSALEAFQYELIHASLNPYQSIEVIAVLRHMKEICGKESFFWHTKRALSKASQELSKLVDIPYSMVRKEPNQIEREILEKLSTYLAKSSLSEEDTIANLMYFNRGAKVAAEYGITIPVSCLFHLLEHGLLQDDNDLPISCIQYRINEEVMLQANQPLCTLDCPILQKMQTDQQTMLAKE